MRISLTRGLFLPALCWLPSVLGAQAPQYFVTPAAAPGGSVRLALVGQPGHAFASFADLSGGPRLFMGEEIFLGLGPGLTPIDSGVFGIGGLHFRSIAVPATGVPTGVVFYLQSLVVDSSARNGAFRVSNGESTVLYTASQVMVEELTDPVLQGFTGTYDRTRRHRLVGAPVTRRVHTVRPQTGTPFSQPIFGPLNPDGARVQMVYRTVDLGSTGQPEVLTALRWLPFGAVQRAAHRRLVVDVGHTHVVPDFTVDPFTALPQFPNSGLHGTFARNQKVGERPVRIIDRAYVVRPQDVRADGYVSYPAPSADFVYNGFNSLLLDFKMEATPGMTGFNGQQIQLMVLSSPRPDARAYARGTPAQPVNPHTVTQGRGDNSMTYMQFEFARVESVATSPWRQAPVSRPDYRAPTLAKSEPTGTTVLVEYRGADSASGTNATIWWNDINFIDRKPFIQYRVTLTGNPRTGAVPSLEAIVIPIN